MVLFSLAEGLAGGIVPRVILFEYVHRLPYGVLYLLTMGGGLVDATTTLLVLPPGLSCSEVVATLQG